MPIGPSTCQRTAMQASICSEQTRIRLEAIRRCTDYRFTLPRAPWCTLASAPQSSRACACAVNAAAHAVVVANRLLGSDLNAGGPVGTLVATYVFRLADGTQHAIPIRERFEIIDLATFGQLPFLALPDEKNGLQERWSGDWSSAATVRPK